MRRQLKLRLIAICMIAILGITVTGTRPIALAMVAAPDTPPHLLIDSQVQGRLMNSPAVVRHRFVDVNQAVLSGNSFSLRLFDNTNFAVTMDSRQNLRDAVGPGAGDGFIWKGHIDGEPGSSVVVIVTPPGEVTANIQLPLTNHVFTVRYAANGSNSVHALYDINTALYPPDATYTAIYSLGCFQSKQATSPAPLNTLVPLLAAPRT